MQPEFPRSPFSPAIQPWLTSYALPPYFCAPFSHARATGDPFSLTEPFWELNTSNSQLNVETPFLVNLPRPIPQEWGLPKQTEQAITKPLPLPELSHTIYEHSQDMEERNTEAVELLPRQPRCSKFKPRRGRTVFTAGQLHELEKVFVVNQYIVGSQRQSLARDLGLTETQIRVWFQNRRIKWRKNLMGHKIKA